MTTLEQALIQLTIGTPMDLKTRTLILVAFDRLEARNADMESQLKEAAVVTGQLTESITNFINRHSVLATIGTNALMACGREE